MADKANLRNFIGGKAREAVLEDKQRDQTPNIRQDGEFANRPFQSGGSFDREEPPKDHMRRYWRQYETTPIVREPINNFARQVVEPGYWVYSEGLDEEQHEDLYKWLQRAAIIEKEPDRDIREMLRKAIVQREVRGTALVEKVYAEEDSDALYGLAFLNSETVRPNSRPGTPLLLLPEDDGKFEGVPLTEDGQAAAYTQFATGVGYGSRRGGQNNSEGVNNFTIDDVVKLTRDADVNEAFGTSRLESCSDTIEGLKMKMKDQNEAIASKAYPLWLFLFGTEEQPWDSDDIGRFMNAHEMDEFHPGLKQGVRGDVSIETISGEVAEISEYLEFDINYIMTAMPLPKYALGAFEANINQFVSQTQERNINQQIKEARRELETEFTPVVRQKAIEMFGLSEDEAEGIEFKIGYPGEEFDKEDPNENIINYDGKDDDNQDVNRMLPPHMQRGGAAAPGGGPDADEDDGGDDNGGGDNNGFNSSADENSIWDYEPHGSVEELAGSRLINTEDLREDLAAVVEQALKQFKEDTLSQIESNYQGAPHSASMAFSGVAHTNLNETLRSNDVNSSARVIMEETIRRSLDSLSDDSQEVPIDTSFSGSHQRLSRQYARRVKDVTRNALEDLVHRLDDKLEVGANNGEELGNIVARMRNTYSDGKISQRANIIAQMELQNAIESTKLDEYERSDLVAGVRVLNPCTESTTTLCRRLGGCTSMSGAVARLDESLSDQWEEQAPSGARREGFRPMPSTPPFHFGCRSELVAVTEAELQEYEKSKPISNVSELEQKYGIEADD